MNQEIRKKQIAILGSTGSIGTQALEVIAEHPDRFEARVLTANTRWQLLAEQARRFLPAAVVIADDRHYEALRSAVDDLPVQVYAGADALCQVVQSSEVDMVLTAMVGFAGLAPTLSAIRARKPIALANKETMVVAGELVNRLCREYEVRLIPHFYSQASGLAVPDGSALHMPLQRLQELAAERGSLQFSCLGASCHSPEDARLAEKLGCTYVTFGHVFETDCKKGLEPRGLERLEETAQSIDIPVYAIGGIAPGNYMSVLEHCAAGACVISGLMQCADPLDYLMSFSH